MSEQLETVADKPSKAKHDFDPANNQPKLRAVDKPVYKIHYARSGSNRSARLYVYGPRTENNARTIAEKRLPQGCKILRVETLSLETACQRLRYGLSLKDVLTPDDYRMLLGDLARVKASVEKEGSANRRR